MNNPIYLEEIFLLTRGERIRRGKESNLRREEEEQRLNSKLVWREKLCSIEQY